MNKREHRDIHEELHTALDKLVADYIGETSASLRDSNILDLIEWSHQQTINPTERT